MIRRILTASMAAILTLPSLVAWGIESSLNKSKSSAFETIALPPVPYSNSMPWLNWKTGVKVDTLLSPTFGPSGIELGPDQRDQSKLSVS